MPKKKVGPMAIYPLLPKTNCGQCPPKVCMGFAVQLAERNLAIEDCPPLLEAKYEENLRKLRGLLAPPVRAVTVGRGDRKVTIGGELVVRRHELRYFHPTALTILVDDTMPEEEVDRTVREASTFTYLYIGTELRLDLLGVRALSGEPDRFASTVRRVAEATELPLLLWSEDPKVLAEGLKVVEDRRPLLYAATKENWRAMGELAHQYGAPLVVYSPNDLNTLHSITSTLREWGLQDLAIDPGCGFGPQLAATINNLTMLRIAAIEQEDPLAGYPLVGAPVRVWDQGNGVSPEVLAWEEACLAALMMVRYADLLILRRPTVWHTLPLLFLRSNLYNDPRKPVSVDPGLRVVGNPGPDDPVLVTTNFALTYYTVMGDIEKLNCYLVVVDTEGLSVESAVAGRKLTADKIADALKAAKLEERIKHRTVILPGMAARLKGDLEDLTRWDVMVGPRDSSAIPGFLKEQWEGRDHTPGWSYR